MTAAPAAVADRSAPAPGALLLAGIVFAALVEAFAGTLLTLGRLDLAGDVHATPDEFSWLDVGYVAAKLVGFLLAPWLLARRDARSVLVAATLATGVACGLAAATARLDGLVALRGIQGFGGGVLLVAAQTLVFVAWPRARQPVLQALFAVGAVVAPATCAPALQGLVVDALAWPWLFFGVLPLALAAAGLLLLDDAPAAPRDVPRPFDATGAALIAASMLCIVYVLSQGSRWDWLDAPQVVVAAAAGTVALVAWLRRQRGPSAALDLAVFGSVDFLFAFAVSFVAGAALFGSAFLIPSFALAALGFTATDAGMLLLPSGAVFVATLFGAAWLMQARGLPPFATVPPGIAAIMVAMWLLSGATRDSGAATLMPALLLRGFGLGLLFLSITLIAFGRLPDRLLASGIALFDAGRQLGGLVGVAMLQTLIQRDTVANAVLLGANVTAAEPETIARLSATTAALVSEGLDPAAAGRAASGLLAQSVSGQSLVLAYDAAFLAVAGLFVVAFPVLIGVKRVLAVAKRPR